MRLAVSIISVAVSNPTSGMPRRVMLVPNPVMYTASNPASLTSRAASPSATPGATTQPGPASNLRNWVVTFSMAFSF